MTVAAARKALVYVKNTKDGLPTALFPERA
jgi:hypothetical protein